MTSFTPRDPLMMVTLTITQTYSKVVITLQEWVYPASFLSSAIVIVFVIEG